MWLLDREGELAEIGAAVEDLSRGVGSVMVVEGPAGIGKSALLQAAGEMARAHGVWVLRACGTSLESHYSYGVVRQWFEREWGRAAAARQLDDPVGLVFSRRAVPLIEDDASFGIVHGLYWFVADLAEQRPLLLMLDDGQWADPESARFLAYLVHRVEGVPVGAFVSLRSGEPGASADFVAGLRRSTGARLLLPRPLGMSATAVLLGRRFAQPVGVEFGRACHRATEGNPYYVVELERALRSAGMAPLDQHAARVQDITPASLERYLLERLAAVGSEAPRLASAMTIVGDGGSLRHAARLAGVEPRRAGELARALVRADVLARDEPVRFAHPLVARVVAAQLSRLESDEWHRATARWLVSERAAAERVAAHLLTTVPRGDQWTVEILRAAAREAMSRSAAEAAARYLRRATAEPPDAESMVGVLRELATAEARLHDPRAIARWRRAHEAAQEPELRARIALELASALLDLYRSVEACAVLDAALKELGPDPIELRGRLHALLVSSAFLDASTAQLGARLLTLRAPPGPAARAVAIQRALGMLIRGEPADQTRAVIEAALAHADERDLAGTFENGLTALVFAEGFDRLPDVLDRFAALPQVRLVRRRLASLALVRGMAASRLGDLGEAELQLRSSLELTPQATSAGGWLVVRGLLADVVTLLGRYDEAERALDDGPPEPWPAHVGAAFASAARARLRMAQGRYFEALDDFDRMAARELALDVRGPSLHQSRCDTALALLATGRADDARGVMADELVRARRFGGPRALGSALRTAGMVEGGVRGRELLEEAVTVLRQSPAVLEHARARVELGAALRRANHRVVAREHLDVGLRLAQRCGARPLASRAYEELLTSGRRLRRGDLEDPAALTAGERRIAQMAADGLTNREIARTLFLSVKTIEMHLGRTYRKLEIATRTELGDALERAG